MSDAGDAGPNFDNQLLTRSLAAYSIHYLSGVDPWGVAGSITDGGDDNGVDAIYYHEPERKMYIVQSKWIHSGSGEPPHGDMLKFVAGLKDLFNMRFERFNSKVQAKRELIERVLTDPLTTYNAVVVYTGMQSLAGPAQTDLDDLQAEMNDASELLAITVLNQSALHNSLTAKLAGEPINVDFTLRSWGKVDEPHLAFYGQIEAATIAGWWDKFGDRLFEKNLRSLLGDTDVNTEMRQTLQDSPTNFWYFNNGITIIANKVTKTIVGGSSSDFGTFHCENISVVNGAQTVSTIGRHIAKAKTSNASVQIRIISLEKAEGELGVSITKTNNRQNRIDNRDFVTLDPEQSRLRGELGVEGVTYHVIRSEGAVKGESSFDLVEATTSLACASGRPSLFVQLKREISKLWEDLNRAPYKELFNANVNSFYVWRVVQTQRMIDRMILPQMQTMSSSGRDLSIGIHGNRLISSVVFAGLPLKAFGDPTFDFQSNVTEGKIHDSVCHTCSKLKIAVDNQYPNAIIPTLFKNLKKCSSIYAEITS